MDITALQALYEHGLAGLNESRRHQVLQAHYVSRELLALGITRLVDIDCTDDVLEIAYLLKEAGWTGTVLGLDPFEPACAPEDGQIELLAIDGLGWLLKQPDESVEAIFSDWLNCKVNGEYTNENWGSNYFIALASELVRVLIPGGIFISRSIDVLHNSLDSMSNIDSCFLDGCTGKHWSWSMKFTKRASS